MSDISHGSASPRIAQNPSRPARITGNLSPTVTAFQYFPISVTVSHRLSELRKTCHGLSRPFRIARNPSRPVNTSQYLSRSPAVSQNCAKSATARQNCQKRHDCHGLSIVPNICHDLSPTARIAQNPSRPAMVSHNSPRPITLGGCLLGPAGRRSRGCIANIDPADEVVNAGSSGEGIGTALTSRQTGLAHSSLILSTDDCDCFQAVYNGNARKSVVFASRNGYNCGQFWALRTPFLAC